MLIGKGCANRFISREETAAVVKAGTETLPIDGKRVLILIPDSTRTMPMPEMFELFENYLGPRAATLDYLVALGTHPPMSDAGLSKLLGKSVTSGKAGRSKIFNHEWSDPAAFMLAGVIPADEIRHLTGGLLEEDVPVRLNKRILDYDQIIICGPVFPHEVVGFSGGNKYFFPGIAGSEIINFTHWLGALITSCKIIGAGYTPVRAVIDRAAAFIQQPTVCFSLVVSRAGLSGIFFGSTQESWQAAADLSAQVHIRYVDEPYQKVIAVMPEMYADLWTAAKGMYKMEPVVADGGELIIYAPHINEVSYSHGKLIDEIGYHCRDYFVKQWDLCKHHPGSILAHSTHVKGLGQYDPDTGVERARIQVSLATGISPERCQRINLKYIPPESINLQDWDGREQEGVLVVPRAGEILYRLREAGTTP